VHGTADPDIPYSNAGLYQKARNSKGLSTEVHLIPDADHTFSSLEWEDKVFRITANWLEQNIR
jgi:dipeptidyl aminopeptidase/acylaminoacyl peptidase